MPHYAASSDPPEEADDGWIHVKSKQRRRGTKSQRMKKTQSSSLDDISDAPKPRTENLRSSEDISAEYRRIRARWEDEAPCRELKRQVSEGDMPPVSRAVCLGIGTFDPPDGGWETKRRTFIQLIAFLVLVESLGESNQIHVSWWTRTNMSGKHKEAIHKSKIECFFQEPVFTTSDKEFIESLGHHVVESPRGFQMIHTRTLLFGVHLYRPIYVKALENYLPAMFVGTDLDVWDW